MSMMSCATFRTPGNDTAWQNLFVLFNAGSSRIVRVRRLVLQADPTGASIALMPLYRLCRISGVSAYSGGQALSKANWTATASIAEIQARGRNTSDGGAQTNITVSAPGIPMWQQYGTRMATQIGQVLGEDQNIAPAVILEYPIILRQNQGLLVYIEAMAGTSNPSSLHHFVQAAWEEVV